MLQQMSSSPSAHVGEVATVLRPLEGRLCGDASSEGSSDATEDLELPQCKIRRNYSCTKCTFYTQNPRAYLIHTRDVHFVKLKIYDCAYCVYASRHHQKLVRHIKMVHGENTADKQTDIEQPSSTAGMVESAEKEEDLIEEVEECDDALMDDDCGDELVERLDADGDVAMASNTTPSTKTKGNFFSCDKCNYVTHIRARYTKHVKYHSMPMIKCTMCDFRTPYKWNLDRHMKNHGGAGSFSCSICNFTADIRQSLTVHEMNHHTPPVGQSSSSRRRNRVGASDLSLAEEMVNGSALVPKEEEGSGDSRSSHSASEMGLQFAERELASSNSDSNDATTSETSNKNDVNITRDSQNEDLSNGVEDSKSHKQNRKISRPIPQLIPLNSSTPNQNKTSTGEPPMKKFKESNSSDSLDSINSNRVESLPPDVTFTSVINNATNNPKETPARKKNESFFDKLKERLLTETGEEGSLRCKNCGFESKCLSEHSVHEKTCSQHSNRISNNTSMSSLSSTRCQNCRHRCKSSADLYVHMKTCKKNVVNETKDIAIETQDKTEATDEQTDKEVEPHPMENVVFVWNNINRETNKFDTPLDISINDDSTLPEPPQSFDSEIVDENESMNLSPSQAVGKKVFKCPHCLFWASTASRFHVHIVGHLNKKPFECSLCKYKSNWRWDITKHIKLKSARDPDHADAKVLMTDETGRRNYSKYNKFLAMPILNEGGDNEFHYIDQNTAVDGSLEIDESYNEVNDNTNTSTDMQPLNLQTQHSDYKYSLDNRNQDMKRLGLLKTLWKCKKCNYRHSSKEALLEHVREHSKPPYSLDEQKSQNPAISKKSESTPDPADLAYRCGHCNQLSNWKHVIQRHCRLKHDGVIKVVTTVKPKLEGSNLSSDLVTDSCTKCPFKSNDRTMLIIHMQQHQPSPQSIFKCYFCPFYVKDEQELVQHLVLHGITEPEDYIAKAMGCKSPLPDQGPQSSSTKRHKCTECPYETNSKSQYMYHEQFHRLPASTPYKCPKCNYSVSKRHLLHQHMRVHGIISKKGEMDSDVEASASTITSKTENKPDYNLEEIPFVWVSAKNEFHKMYKCRYCSYVNTQKCKIQNHEKIHCIILGNNEIFVYKCLDCKFTIDNARKLSEHSKTHGEIYGRIYCPVEADISDEEQIAKLRKVIELEKNNASDDLSKEDYMGGEIKVIKTLYFCQQCPARYFSESELKVHDKFHDLTFTYKCNTCEFSALHEDELTAHTSVHSDEYHTKTKMLKFIHNTHPAHTEPRLELIHCTTSSDMRWVVANPAKNYEVIDVALKKSYDGKHIPKQYQCKECPAKFFKNSALNYHMGLHGGDGEHKCKKCSYSVKNIGNLAKHELLHDNEGKSTCDYESGEDMDYKNIPLSGTDLFQRKTEAQKRVLNDKDKLVKPNDHFPPVLQADPQFGYLMHGNPEFVYPTYLKNGRQKEKRYKCHKCPSAFEKREQYKIHLSLHGSKQRYKCELCDYSVKYYANYVQHMRKHQKNDEALAERRKGSNECQESEPIGNKQVESTDNIKLAIKTMPKGLPKSDFQQFSISDQQTLRLLQRRCSLNNSLNDVNQTDSAPIKDRKLHSCFLCPYTNQRQDALGNHYRRHDKNDVFSNGNHKCSFCDLAVVQSHFLREHLKTHFNYQKTLTPECYVANEDVRFTITKLDKEDIITDLKLDIQSKIDLCNEEKIFVKIKTGELLVE
ncbi:zinc finger protein 91-like [Battus philenor]|uniref:zinc finger protein 91-like n=1 Tax=Battus philenor TaxID=42288 RepID=UPI0035CF101E